MLQTPSRSAVSVNAQSHSTGRLMPELRRLQPRAPLAILQAPDRPVLPLERPRRKRALIQMQARMLATFETLERDQQGYATINGLLAVITSMRNLPGRKTIIFFSEGIALPPSVQVKFPSVINAANRAGVSIYPIDAAGLRADSPNAEATREINALARAEDGTGTSWPRRQLGTSHARS